MSTELDLEEAILDSELRYVNFFNGRLLTGGDLSAEQAANRACSRHLGLAVGAGVANGLEVSISPGSLPTAALVDVAAGLALNLDGQTLRLESKQTVALIRPPDQISAASCVFADCELLAAGTTLSSAGFYLLTIAPASARDGLAPASGLGNGIADCNSRYLVDGVQFRLLPLNITSIDNPALERNSVAYQCFGLPVLGPGDFLDNVSSGTSPFAYGVKTLVPSGRLTQQDVPLALIEWTTNGLGFIDQWSVRRRVSRPDATGLWGYFVADRRVSEGEAMFLEFQEHFASLETGASPPSGLTADACFQFLPPAGVLPDSDGTFWSTFLGPLGPSQETAIDASLWPRLLRDSFTLEPVPVPAFSSVVTLNILVQQFRANPASKRLFNAVRFGSTAAAAKKVSLAQPNAAATQQIAGPAEPPAPLKIYRVPGRNEVLFVRARLGRVRLFFTEAINLSGGVSVGIQVTNSNLLLFAVANPLSAAEYIIDDVPAGTHPLVSIFLERTGDSALQHFEVFISQYTVSVVEGRTTDWREPAFLQRARIQTDRASLFRTAQPG
jgi:hypothetical protein